MLLYRTHPTSKTTNTVTNLRDKEEFVTSLSDNIDHSDNDFDTITALVTDASVLDAMISLGNYENILVLPTPIDQERLVDDKQTSLPFGAIGKVGKSYTPIGNAGDMLFPVVHNFVGGKGNVYVGLPEEGHLYKRVWEDYNVNILPMSNWFTLDRKIGIETDIVFDAVVLLGCKHSHKTGGFNSEDIKGNLKGVIHENTHLIDVNRELSKRDINGKKQDISDNKTTFIQNINSTQSIYNDPLWQPSFLGFNYGFSLQLEMMINEDNWSVVDKQWHPVHTGIIKEHQYHPPMRRTGKQYINLCFRNIKNLETFYKVYI